MEKREYLIMLLESQGLKPAPETVEEMLRDGGIFDMLQLNRSILYQLDLKDTRPIDDIKFELQEDAT